MTVISPLPSHTHTQTVTHRNWHVREIYHELWGVHASTCTIVGGQDLIEMSRGGHKFVLQVRDAPLIVRHHVLHPFQTRVYKSGQSVAIQMASHAVQLPH